MNARPIGVAALSLLVVAASLAAVGCGGSGPSKAEIAQERARLTSILTAQVVKRESQDALKAARTDETKCRAQIGRALSLLDAQPQYAGTLPGLGGYLADVDTYRVKVDEIETELNRIPRGSLNPRCLKVLQSLSAAAAVHNRVLQEWSECMLRYGAICGATIGLCTVAKPKKSDCTSDLNYATASQFDLALSIMRDTADIMRWEWKAANRKTTAATKDLLAIGRQPRPINRPSPFIPRTDADVPGSAYGLTARLMCKRDVPKKAIDACQSLHDVLAGGVSAEEEADLNDALSQLVSALGWSN